MDILEAIYGRRAIRSFTAEALDVATTRLLLHAAVQAPSALDSQAWSFVVVQDHSRLSQYSEIAKRVVLEQIEHDPKIKHYEAMLRDPAFDIFYGASTLIAICAPIDDPWHEANCWLATENLMLAAHGLGFGSCCIGFALPLLNQASIKAELSIPSELATVAAVVVGRPATVPKPIGRRPPHILSWTTARWASELDG